MLNSSGFDLWADGYDKSVQLSEEDDAYPFAGYRKVLGTIYRSIRESRGTKVLDMGLGTAVLAQRLYQDGYEIFGLDFSEKMLEIAREKMPGARLIQYDFSWGFPPAFAGERFDFIVCTYAIHHLDDRQKAELIWELLPHLTEEGLILIGDVAFQTAEELAECRKASGGLWDEEELYMVEETMSREIPNLHFEKLSFCSGVFTITKQAHGGTK